MQPLTNFVSIQNLNARQLVINHVEDQHAVLAIQRNVPMSKAPRASRAWHGVKCSTKIITASAAVNNVKLRNLCRQLWLAILHKQCL